MEIDPTNPIEVALAKMGLHNTDRNVSKVKSHMVELQADIRTLEGWVQELVDNLEGRVTQAFAAQLIMIDEVEDKVDEFHTTQKEQNNKFDSIIKKHNDEPKALKKAVEDLRDDGPLHSARQPSWSSTGIVSSGGNSQG